MNYAFLIFGLAATLYGIYTFIIRIKNPGRLRKLEATKKALGDRTGTAIHTIAYSIIPIIFGIVFILLSLK